MTIEENLQDLIDSDSTGYMETIVVKKALTVIKQLREDVQSLTEKHSALMRQLNTPNDREPVIYQVKEGRNSDRWKNCSKQHAENIINNPNKWAGFSARRLFDRP